MHIVKSSNLVHEDGNLGSRLANLLVLRQTRGSATKYSERGFSRLRLRP
jgi:hypothetical protein